MRSRLIALGLVLGVLALSGCFVLDEIDSGQQVMKKHSPRVRAEEAKKKQAPAAPAAEARVEVVEIDARERVVYARLRVAAGRNQADA